MKNDASALFDYQTFLKTVPKKNGIYIMYDHKQGTILYVGKAKNLYNRVSSYFQKNLSVKNASLMSQVHYIDIILTLTENDALILENDYIKKYAPKYNILLRDDKSYPYIHVSDDDFPKLSFYRGKKNKKRGKFFGPYPNAAVVKETITLLQKIFKLRECDNSVFKHRSRPCLQYQIQCCSAPCVNYISTVEYNEQIKLAILFLEGKDQSILHYLMMEMEKASEKLEYEKAIKYRNQIQLVRKIQEKQSVNIHQANIDIIAVIEQYHYVCCHILIVRNGKIIFHQNYFPTIPLNTPLNEILRAFLLQYYMHYSSNFSLPKEIIINIVDFDAQDIIALFKEKYQKKVLVKHNVMQARKNLQELSKENAMNGLTEYLQKNKAMSLRYQDLQKMLNLKEMISRIECFDISHALGEQTKASCVVFNPEGAVKSEYRVYNIQNITAGDDYAAMEQALTKRFKNLDTNSIVPSVLLIDGGMGQLSSAEKIISDLFRDTTLTLPILIGVAKGKERKAGKEVLILGYSRKLFDTDNYGLAFLLIQQIRDEAHRFAINSHRFARRKEKKRSIIEDIPGIGAKRRKALLNYFGSLQKVKQASLSELQKVSGINLSLAQMIREYLE